MGRIPSGRLLWPARVQADGKGGFFTIESTPRRIAHFTGGSTLPDREWSASALGSMMTIDPEDPSVAYLKWTRR